MSYNRENKVMLNSVNTVYNKSLTAESPLVGLPDGILKVPLRQHQQAVLAAMEEKERLFSTGMDISGEVYYGKYGILGDSVGVGKSLMILGHIARLKEQEFVTCRKEVKSAGGSQSTFSIRTKTISQSENEAQNLLIIPHTLFRQWSEYIKNQTNLTALFLDKVSLFQEEDFKEKLLKADIVLVSNTMFKYLYQFTSQNPITWRRVFIDEADSIHIVSSTSIPEARFYWFVSASWMNVLFGARTYYIYQLNETILQNPGYHQNLKDYFKSIARTYPHTSSYAYASFTMRSWNYFRDVHSTHHLQGHCVIRCSDDYIKSSISLPQLFKYVIQCRAPAIHNVVANFITDEVKNLLHAGDTKGAMAALGVKEEDAVTLVAAVTQNRMKELDRLKKTYEFKSGLEYSSEHAKETALKNLTEKINEIEVQVKSIQERIQNYKSECCPICYDEPAEAVLTPCCTQVFCGSCILASLQRNPSCPMCRATMTPKSLKRILNQPVEGAVAAPAEEQPQLEKKIDALIRIIKNNPQGKFLVFSRYDNPFDEIENVVAEMNMKVKQLKGNKDVIASTLRQFADGKIQCLLLNAAYAGAGLNITAATHVILTHAMSLEEEKQILGRAYRMGRKEPLHFYKLLHENETELS